MMIVVCMIYIIDVIRIMIAVRNGPSVVDDEICCHILCEMK